MYLPKLWAAGPGREADPMTRFGADFWDARFDTEQFVYGTEATAFLQEQALRLEPGSRILVPADGEGRNSAFLAGLGHSVVATDLSDHGLEKARQLAKSRGVVVEHLKADIQDWQFPDAAFDAIVGVFIQFLEPAARAQVFEGMRRTVRPGGLVLLHGYTEAQLEHGTGGPPIREQLYSEKLLRDAFAGWELLRLQSYERVLEEGTGHVGQSALIDLIARRPT